MSSSRAQVSTTTGGSDNTSQGFTGISPGPSLRGESVDFTLDAQTHFASVAELVNLVTEWLPPEDVLSTSQVNKKWRGAVMWDGYEEDKEALKHWDGDLHEIEYSRDTFRPYMYWVLCSVLTYIIYIVCLVGFSTTGGSDADAFEKYILTLYSAGGFLCGISALLGFLFAFKGSLKCHALVTLLMIFLAPANLLLLHFYSVGVDVGNSLENLVIAESDLNVVRGTDGITCRVEGNGPTPVAIKVQNPSSWKSSLSGTDGTMFYLDNGGTWEGPTYSGVALQYTGNKGFPEATASSSLSSYVNSFKNSPSSSSPSNTAGADDAQTPLSTRIYIYNPFPYPYSYPVNITLVKDSTATPSNTTRSILLLYRRNGVVDAFDPIGAPTEAGQVNIVSPGFDSIYKYGDWNVTFASGDAASYPSDIVDAPPLVVDVIRSLKNIPLNTTDAAVRKEDEFQIRDLVSTLFKQSGYDGISYPSFATNDNAFSTWDSAQNGAEIVCFNNSDFAGVCGGLVDNGHNVLPATQAGTSPNSCITPTILIGETEGKVLTSSGSWVQFSTLPKNSILWTYGESYWLRQRLWDDGSEDRKDPIYDFLLAKAYPRPAVLASIVIEESFVKGARVQEVLCLVFFFILLGVYVAMQVFVFYRHRKIDQVFYAEQRMEEQKQRWRLKRKFPPHKMVAAGLPKD